MNCKNFSKHLSYQSIWIIHIIQLICIQSVFAQFNESEFIYRTRNKYYTLEDTGLDNFSSWITSETFADQAKKIFKQEIYPFELIWKTPDQLFFIKRPVPEIDDSETREILENQLNQLLEDFKEVLKTWKQLTSTNILNDLPDNRLIVPSGDSIHVEFIQDDANRRKQIKMSFRPDGRCTKIVSTASHENEIDILVPKFISVDEKWLCNGWKLMCKRFDRIERYDDVNLYSKKIADFWILTKIAIRKQRGDVIDKKTVLNFKNIVLNKDLKILTN